MTPLIKGLIAAVFTPMSDDGTIKLNSVRVIVDHLKNQGIQGVFICGSTGEGMSLSLNERKQVLEAYVSLCDGQLLTIAHVGCNSLKEAQELALHACAVGVDAVSMTSPVFYPIKSASNLVDCLSVICEKLPEKPLYYYHIPSLTGVQLDLLQFLEISKARLPQLRGIKFTAPQIHEYQACAQLSDGHFDILYGMDEMMLSALSTGCQGFIGSTFNYMPSIYNDLITFFNQGRLDRAKEQQLMSVQLVRIINKFGGLPAQKSIMKMIGVDCGPVRLPLSSITKSQEADLKNQLEALGFFNWIKEAPLIRHGG